MAEIFDVVLQYLDEDDWSYGVLEEKTVAKFGVSADIARFECFADAIEDKEIFLFYVMAPNKVPKDKRLAVAEFITRANVGLLLGNFELDMDTGEVRYKSSVDIEGGKLTTTMVRNIIHSAVATMNDYYQGLMSVIFSNSRPDEAILAIEETSDDLAEDIIASLEASLKASPEEDSQHE